MPRKLRILYENIVIYSSFDSILRRIHILLSILYKHPRNIHTSGMHITIFHLTRWMCYYCSWQRNSYIIEEALAFSTLADASQYLMHFLLILLNLVEKLLTTIKSYEGVCPNMRERTMFPIEVGLLPRIEWAFGPISSDSIFKFLFISHFYLYCRSFAKILLFAKQKINTLLVHLSGWWTHNGDS